MKSLGPELPSRHCQSHANELSRGIGTPAATSPRSLPPNRDGGIPFLCETRSTMVNSIGDTNCHCGAESVLTLAKLPCNWVLPLNRCGRWRVPDFADIQTWGNSELNPFIDEGTRTSASSNGDDAGRRGGEGRGTSRSVISVLSRELLRKRSLCVARCHILIKPSKYVFVCVCLSPRTRKSCTLEERFDKNYQEQQ